jgi:hypothetical protein
MFFVGFWSLLSLPHCRSQRKPPVVAAWVADSVSQAVLVSRFRMAASLTASSFVTVSSHAAVSSQDPGSLGLGSSFHFAILIPIIGPGPYLDW